MTLQNKILPVALVAALLGGGVGAFVTRSGNPSTTTSATTTAAQPSTATTEATAPATTTEQAKTDTATVTGDQQAFREGFAEGYRAATGTSDSAVAPGRSSSRARQVVYRTTSRRSRSVASNAGQRVYYDYNTQPRQRSFWQKHRDKLTVAMGTGGGAILGGLIGGKKGAAIGALAGAGGSALYTYKIRKRNRNY
ncbi:MAG TPA: hypothetical protein VF544_10600 [Pyrinomonadaceae bacterium]|jgi:hypothetical protein